VSTTGFSHPKCYARALADCSTKISTEHYVSKSVLNILGDFHVRSNTSWLAPTAKSQPLPASVLGSNILCTRHNEMLSDIDTRVIPFFTEVCSSFSVSSGAVPHQNVRIDGDALELWVLKACCGALASGELAQQGSKATYELPYDWLRVLFAGAPWPRNTGLHIRLGRTVPHRGFTIGPVFSGANKELSGGGFEFCGVELFVLMTPDVQKVAEEESTKERSPLIYRPGAIEIKTPTHTTRIELQWKTWHPTATVVYTAQNSTEDGCDTCLGELPS